MNNDRFFYSVDWGTTRLRVRLVQREPFSVLGEASSDDGVAPVHKAWAAGRPGPRRSEFFAERLAAVLQTCAPGEQSGDAPVIVSGMASSSIGMAELPYTAAPTAAAGDGLRLEQTGSLEAFPAGVLLVSGVATPSDVVRGEETELAGLVEQDFGDGVYVLPGTHSKHLTVRRGALVGIKTYLTGELHQLLTRRSVLAATVGGQFASHPGPVFRAAAREAAADGDLLGSLFSVRARALLDDAPPSDGAERLAGLLIGSEVAGLGGTGANDPIILSANERLRPLYTAAIEEVTPGAALRVVSQEQHAGAVPRAHARLLRLHEQSHSVERPRC